MVCCVHLQVDILHPLATLHWEECCKLPEGMIYAQCVSINGNVYVSGNGDTHNKQKLYISSKELNSWSAVPTPSFWYALTTYHSHLVLVGGRETTTNLVSNKLWTLNSSLNFQTSLPPMPTARFSLTAVTTTTPDLECIVVAGGGDEINFKNVVEVFSQEQWATVQPLPKKCQKMMSTLHNGKLYLMGGYPQERAVYYCDVKLLIAEKEVKETMQLWHQYEAPLSDSSVASFEQHLITIGGEGSGSSSFSSKIFAQSPLSQQFVLAGNIPIKLSVVGSIVLPTGELAVIGGCNVSGSNTVFRASLRGEKNYINKHLKKLNIPHCTYIIS